MVYVVSGPPRAELTIQQLKVTLLVDMKVNAILNLHATTTKKTR